MNKENKNIQLIDFKLSLDEANLILKALGKLPFEQVYELIGKLNRQANSQLKNFNTIEKDE